MQNLLCQAKYAIDIKSKLSSEDDVIASLLMHLVGNQKNWGFFFGLGFLYLRNIKGFG